MNIRVLATIGSLLFGLSLLPSTVEAFCAGDNGWKNKFATIAIASPTSVSASASVEIDHASNHPSCFGEMKARAQVPQAGCAGSWDVDVHNGSDASDSSTGFVTCGAECGPSFRAGGEALWNESSDQDFGRATPCELRATVHPLLVVAQVKVACGAITSVPAWTVVPWLWTRLDGAIS